MEIEIIRTNTPTDTTINFGIILGKILSQIKMLHWYSNCYNSHMIFGELYESLDNLFDKLQEEIIGTVKTTGVDFPEFSVDLFKDPNQLIYTDKEYVYQEFYKICNDTKNVLCSSEFKGYVESIKSGIANTKDEILTSLNKTAYLLSLTKN
jgi:hypothetical protein